jgi:hypothetical protein
MFMRCMHQDLKTQATYIKSNVARAFDLLHDAAAVMNN